MPERAARRAEARAMLGAWQRIENSYKGGVNTRLTTGYPPSRGMGGSNHALRESTLRAMRDRSRNLDRNNPVAASLLDRAVENVIGHGMKLQAQTEDDGFNEEVEALWSDWWCDGRADIRGMMTGAQMEQLWYREHLRDGDFGVILHDLGPDQLYVQTIPGEQIDTEYGGNDDKTRTYSGIQFDKYGRPVAFNVMDEETNTYRQTSKKIPARDFIFFPRMKDAQQVRGEPLFATVFDLFDNTSGIIDAAAVAVRIATCQAMIVKKAAPSSATAPLQESTNSQGRSQKIQTIEPGMIHYLQVGEEVESFNPHQPQQNLSEFLRFLFRTVGIAAGLPLEILLLDFSQSNYSNARAALLQLQRAARPQQRLFCKRVMSRIYQWRVSKWAASGQLKVPNSISQTYWDHNFLPPGWAWIDPDKDGRANMMKLDANLTTLSQIAAEQGEEWEDIAIARARELKMAKKLELPETRSNQTRDVGLAAGEPAQPNSPPKDKDDDDE
jgi:lambda family phage portal protein